MKAERYLAVTADDFGIGPETSRGILDLARLGRVTSTVLLVTSPHAEDALRAWRQAGEPLELGWHPCLTLDQPIAPLDCVRTLVDGEGRFWSLGSFVRRLWLRQINPVEIETELRAQFERCRELLGRPPSVVNSHHHVQVFAPVGKILRELLAKGDPLPYLRRVTEPWQSLWRVPGARAKRTFLTLWGGFDARRQRRAGFAGNQALAGITNPACVADPRFLERWLAHMPGRVVELTCHPGHLDATLIGRDCTGEIDRQLKRRVFEYRLLESPSFVEACRAAGFRLVAPADLTRLYPQAFAHAA